MARRFGLDHRIILGFLLTAHLMFFGVSAASSASNDDILKRISTTAIKKAIESGGTVDEIAARVGVNTAELKTICAVLKIDLPVPPEPKPTPPPVIPPKVATAGELLTDAIIAYKGKSPYILLVDKSEYKLYLLKYENGHAVIQETFKVKTGKNSGDKQERGDHKTPEGIYFFTDKYNRRQIESQVGKENAFQYGDMAFVTTFPNIIDRVKGKNGGGIWLHGTDEPFEGTPSRDTRGCVVTTNETIKKLSSFISLEQTPLIVTDKVRIVPQGEIESLRAEVLAMIENWRSSWEEKRIDDYIRHYSPQFSAQGMNRDQWRERKAGLAKVNGSIKINLTDFTVLRQKDSMVVSFIQDYSAENVSNVGLKTLYLIDGNDGPLIVTEYFQKN